ncbi:hypothetical protein QQF64_010901 [Cirrhinus molitorella]|uniref:Uncharacterized protein n=1 Tax=Cirrhinus molitorella TaxID=172907 RepID=A0ABR3LXN6_9TELE
MLSGPSAAEFSRLGVFIMGVRSIFRKPINTSARSGQACTEHCHPKTSVSPGQDAKTTGASVRFSELMIASARERPTLHLKWRIQSRGTS